MRPLKERSVAQLSSFGSDRGGGGASRDGTVEFCRSWVAG